MTEDVDKIKNVVTDLVGDLLYYDRKESEYLPLGTIENAVKNKDISCDDIILTFATELKRRLKEIA